MRRTTLASCVLVGLAFLVGPACDTGDVAPDESSLVTAQPELTPAADVDAVPKCDGRTWYSSRYWLGQKPVRVDAANAREARLLCAQVLIEQSKPAPGQPLVECPGCPLWQDGCQVTGAKVARWAVGRKGGTWYCRQATKRRPYTPIYWRCSTCEDNGACGGFVGIPCDEGEFCEFPGGTCSWADHVGTCVEIPDPGCPEYYAPECGCDGVTYDNDCFRQAAAVSKDHDGPCEHKCETNADCAKGEYCAADGCGMAGQCAVRPEFCITLYDPVCGCDGKTYGNSCSAASAGVNVDYQGECDTGAGCTENSECADNEYCAKAFGDCDGTGECALRPEACIMLYDPVCGCDGKTYGNGCTAASAGMNVQHDGECAPPTKLKWYSTCGYPVCHMDDTPPAGIPLCENGETEGDPCTDEGVGCDAGLGCGSYLICASSDPKAQGCPISEAKHKKEIEHLDAAAIEEVYDELMCMDLATYRYKSEDNGPGTHLGFIIDEVGRTSPAVRPGGERVDLYGFTSMAVAAIQHQARQIEALEQELKALRAELDGSRAKPE